MPVNRATNVAITLRQFSDCSIADIRRGIVNGQMKAERVSLLRMVLPCLLPARPDDDTSLLLCSCTCTCFPSKECNMKQTQLQLHMQM